MKDQACALPTRANQAESASIQRMLAGRRIAIVGLSDDASRPSHGIARYLLAAGKEIIPINPNCRVVMGLPCYPSLEAAPGPIDVVDVFRRPEHCADVARSAIAVGAKGIWLQSGITSDKAAAVAARAGIDYVENRC